MHSSIFYKNMFSNVSLKMFFVKKNINFQFICMTVIVCINRQRIFYKIKFHVDGC